MILDVILSPLKDTWQLFLVEFGGVILYANTKLGQDKSIYVLVTDRYKNYGETDMYIEIVI